MNDLKFALRQLRKSPGFTLIAVLTLALGIGLNTAIFSLVNDLFLRGLAFKESSRVVHLYGGDKSRDLTDIDIGAPRYFHFRDGQTVFESLAGESFFAFTLTGLGDPVQVSGGLYARADRDVPPPEQRANGPSHDIAPAYFKTWGVPLLAGREFNEHDTAEGQNVCLISQAGAKKVYPNENPIGKTLLVTGLGVPVEIVGVVGDVRSIRVAEAPIMEFYRPLAQENFPFVNVTVRTSLKLDAATKAVQSALSKVNPSLAIAVPQMMDAVVAQALGQARLMTWLLGIFAGVALLLASIGIYGAVAYSVEQRTGEIGVRMALGAQTRDVLRLVVNQGMKPIVIGLAIGIASAFVLGRLLTTQLYEVSAHNPALLVGSTVLLAAIALIACVVPARRAAHVDPMVALHYE
jgi:putative ABC transport system permease protein